jgi:hypothetical protein
MQPRDLLGTVEVGQRARDAQHAMIANPASEPARCLTTSRFMIFLK